MRTRVDLLPLLLVAGGLLVLLAGQAVYRPIPGTAPAHDENSEEGAPAPQLSPASVTLGARVYREQCASCHGANREGQPNWKQTLPDGTFPAPPHDDSGHTWHHPDALLVSIIREGGNGNPAMKTHMPAFKDKLTDAEINAVLDYLKSGWSPIKRAYQWRMTSQPHDEQEAPLLGTY